MARPGSTPLPARRRAGCTVLALLADPLCARALRAHAEGPLQFPDLVGRIDGASPGGLRTRVTNLRTVGALERRALERMPYAVENELTGLGRDILDVADIVEAWLAQSPRGPIPLGDESAKSAIGALVNGWESTILWSLARHPLTLSELDGALPDIAYPSIERRLSAMRTAGLVEARNDVDKRKPYAVTDWMRQATKSLLVAARCEYLHLGRKRDSLSHHEIEAGFRLALPLISLPNAFSGTCVLAVGDDDKGGLAQQTPAVPVEIRNGLGLARNLRDGEEWHAWALGTAEKWVQAIVDGKPSCLRIGGEEPVLAQALVTALHLAS